MKRLPPPTPTNRSLVPSMCSKMVPLPTTNTGSLACGAGPRPAAASQAAFLDRSWRIGYLLQAFLLFFLFSFSPANAQETERSIAEWIIRLGGGVTLDASSPPIRDLPSLPPGDIRILGLDFTGTLVTPEDLPKLKGLTSIKQLFLPAYMWNEGAGSNRDSNKLLSSLATLKTLEHTQFSVHVLTNINVQDSGIALLAPLTNLRQLRLAQTRIRGTTLAPGVNLRALDASYTPFNDEGMAALKGMKHLERLIVRDTLVTDAGLVHLEGLTELRNLDLYGCRISDSAMPSLKALTKLRKLNL